MRACTGKQPRYTRSWELEVFRLDKALMKESIIRTKSYAFALKIVRLFQDLCDSKHEFILSKQLLRCGTSIGANVEESTGAISEKEFTAKLHIAFKEALETRFWIRLLHDANYIEATVFQTIYADCDELIRILSSITKSMREKGVYVHENSDDDTFTQQFSTTQLPTPNS